MLICLRVKDLVDDAGHWRQVLFVWGSLKHVLSCEPRTKDGGRGSVLPVPDWKCRRTCLRMTPLVPGRWWLESSSGTRWSVPWFMIIALVTVIMSEITRIFSLYPALPDSSKKKGTIFFFSHKRWSSRMFFVLLWVNCWHGNPSPTLFKKKSFEDVNCKTNFPEQFKFFSHKSSRKKKEAGERKHSFPISKYKVRVEIEGRVIFFLFSLTLFHLAGSWRCASEPGCSTPGCPCLPDVDQDQHVLLGQGP